MSNITCDVGDEVTIQATFTVGGTATDPTAVTLYVNDPSGNVSTPSTSNPSTGVYTATVAIDEAGGWRYLWLSTGTAAAAEEGTITARTRQTATS